MRRFFHPAHMSAGLIAVVVGYTSSAAIIFQAASAVGATPAQIGSWLWALGIGMGVTSAGLAWWHKTPVLTAWSTPGAALLVTALAGVSMGEAVGAFLFASALAVLCGVTGWFDTLMQKVPKAIAAAMLAGVLLRFGLGAFTALPAQPWLVGGMLLGFLLLRRHTPRFAVPLTLLIGLALAAAQGLIHLEKLTVSLAQPVWMAPEFSWSALIGVGLPLFVVTMASQNMPGVAVLRANGYTLPVSPLVGWTGLAGVLLAPFGGFSFNLAAITAAICMSPDADPDPAQRYRASIWAGLFYIATGMLGATVVGLFSALPQALILAIAGLALLGTIGNGLASALEHPGERDAALMTFVVTASGMSLFGIGSAFWGLVLGLLTALLQRRG
ncbi:benzoate/H(+) symporter BenE family transporter [Rivihabitans pingtungensis]|jgi:benzoate membrane transport protein|uniref:Benzoate membrane transport protein n=1 Tax=Rivihabitans pingtungensis TaxID=1054498 RepID=A0A318KEQ5_9NEIS|nr:benzoate/H(+) symporter BenE family transporter [Rivihabitans pingtungensis]PXX75264.1 benzoate membrane transport protein [Rivihabitans pingtungensis]HNX70360.1 benzoate/H(+) symporter BenE family transporter [Rivihabitans pingtungensis]